MQTALSNGGSFFYCPFESLFLFRLSISQNGGSLSTSKLPHIVPGFCSPVRKPPVKNRVTFAEPFSVKARLSNSSASSSWFPYPKKSTLIQVFLRAFHSKKNSGYRNILSLYDFQRHFILKDKPAVRKMGQKE